MHRGAVLDDGYRGKPGMTACFRARKARQRKGNTVSSHRLLSGKIVIATHNQGKLREMRELLARYGIELVSAGELGLPEPEENGHMFAENAAIKAVAAANASGLPALSRLFRHLHRRARRRARPVLRQLGWPRQGFRPGARPRAGGAGDARCDDA